MTMIILLQAVCDPCCQTTNRCPRLSVLYTWTVSVAGVYGDQVNEMSWAVGQVLDLVRQLHMEQDTLAVFFSDHGPHVEICEEGGSAAPFRGCRWTFTC